jgi:inorganic pyrophosphatase
VSNHFHEPFVVVVEIPKGSRNKYEMDHDTGRLRLDRTLFTSTQYPADYGFVDETLGRDGDPLDALLLVGQPTFPGCEVSVRAVAMYCMSDEDGPDEKILCVPAKDPRYDAITDLEDISKYDLLEITHFFDVYKDLEPGKSVEGSRWEGAEAAYNEIERSQRRHVDHTGDMSSGPGRPSRRNPRLSPAASAPHGYHHRRASAR